MLSIFKKGLCTWKCNCQNNGLKGTFGNGLCVSVGSHLGSSSGLSPSCCEKLICLLPFIKASAIIFRICTACLGSVGVPWLKKEACLALQNVILNQRVFYSLFHFNCLRREHFQYVKLFYRPRMKNLEVWKLLYVFRSPSIALRVIYTLSQNLMFCGMNSVYLMEDP